MLAGYLTDIEQLLEEQRWDAALLQACDLPRIAVALSDPELRASDMAVDHWCRQWVASEAQQTESAESAAVAPEVAAPEVPTRALRRLQLRRHVRTPPRGFRVSEDENLAPQESESSEAGRALVGATRRWYARSGCHDPTVQSNLARLAVLR